MEWDRSLFAIMGTFWVCYAIIRTFFVRPMMRLLEERRGTVESARALWEQVKSQTDAELQAEQASLLRERQEARRARESVVKAAQEERARILQAAKSEATSQLETATRAIEDATAEQRKALESRAQSLAEAVITRLAPGATR